MRNYQLLPLLAAMMSASTSAIANLELEDQLAEFEYRLDQLENQSDSTNLENQVSVTQGDSGFDVNFHGYARYGLQYQGGSVKNIYPFGGLNSNTLGRLGNEGNGGEFQLKTSRTTQSGAKWDIVYQVEDWGGGGVTTLMYAGAANVFESQPDAYIWAGLGGDRHRTQSDLNDYFWIKNDGVGTGINDLNLGGGVKLNAYAIESTMDNKGYALISKLHGIDLFGTSLSFHANYGIPEKNDAKYKAGIDAYQLAAEWQFAGQHLVVRYSNNGTNSVFDLVEGDSALLFSLEGAIPLTEKSSVRYLTAYQTYDTDNKIHTQGELKSTARDNFNTILRPMYYWNAKHSTWLELGYSAIKFEDDDINEGWKATLSQNIMIDGFGGVPMLRFYVTYGETDNEQDWDVGGWASEQDALTFGAMFEAWW